ncbi:membrane protein insertase YidC [Synoicihabitans lomoniglobus]|uniref:Membrane protein insertase YidC n=1 Tax=Synoicihabitans lomoniglobus TaxID=2909285 RepID=A0AAF0CN10_9BACT|nr:YidC/Oxa1 family insertase periplasmic-domain containing protein [Opitutaceae bacterium LMO-M01]WED63815.1 YidC/Oxa1 family insertase periplasmic-domain containing protein [Opitutaceae bacterium LMO-M01]
MDKKNTVIGILLLVAAFGVFFYGQRFAPPAPPAPEVVPVQAPLPTATNQAAPTESSMTSSPADAEFAALAGENANEVLTILENDFVRVSFTNFGGAIGDVAFKHYTDAVDSSLPFVFNHPRVEPILAITNVPGIGPKTAFKLVSATNSEVVYRAVLEGRLEVTRRYSLGTGAEGSDPYLIRHDTAMRDLSGKGSPSMNAGLSLGTSSLVSPNDYGQFLNVMSWDGEDETLTKPGELKGGGFLAAIGLKDGASKSSLTKGGEAVWAAVKNQFFVSVYTGDTPGFSTTTRRVELPPFPGSTRANEGITGVLNYTVPAVAGDQVAALGGDLYVGPKEYDRLRDFENKQSEVMQFAPYFFSKIFLSGVVGPILNLTMVTIERWIGNWGVAIILMTLLLKLVTLPFTLAASRSAKKMAKLQPLMKEVREKFKDQPQKLNEATLKIFKENKVNPMGGCIPILITMPLFVAFFAMLQGTAELRFQGFLWVTDLSAPDTVARIFGLPINIMPLLMGATMIYQMKLTPTPTTDNAQAQMMKFMPIVFTLICYNFAAALALYSTVNGLFTIAQQIIVNKTTKDDGAVVNPTEPVKSSAWNPKKKIARKKK